MADRVPLNRAVPALVLALALAGAGIWWAADTTEPPAAGPSPSGAPTGSPSATDGGRSGPSSADTGEPTESRRATPSDDPTPSDDETTDSEPGAGPTEGASEPPDDPDGGERPEGEVPGGESGESAPAPTSPGTDPLLPLPLPPDGNAQGRLVAGYPTKVLPPVPGSRILTSSLTSHGRRLQVSLSASTSRSAEQVLAFYRGHLAALGFTEAESPAVPGATARVFTRDPHRLVITVTPGPHHTGYAILATVVGGR